MDAERTTWRKREGQRGRRKLILGQRMNSLFTKHVIPVMSRERESERERRFQPDLSAA